MLQMIIQVTLTLPLKLVQIRSETNLPEGQDGKRRGKRNSTKLIIQALKKREAGVNLSELCRKYGIAEQTYYRWHKKYGGMDAGDARRLKDQELESFNDKFHDEGLHENCFARLG